MTDTIDLEQLSKLLTVTQVADLFEVPARVVRKAAKGGKVPGQVSVLGRFGFDPEKVLEWLPPETSERVVGVRRPDGRQRYRIYLTADEAAKLLSEGYAITNPREAAKARRAARKAAKTGAAPAVPEAGDTKASDDPFADFGV